jgi:hypothetical protein
MKRCAAADGVPLAKRRSGRVMGYFPDTTFSFVGAIPSYFKTFSLELWSAMTEEM